MFYEEWGFWNYSCTTAAVDVLCLSTYYSLYLQIDVTHLDESLEHVPAGMKRPCSCSDGVDPRL